MAEINHYLFYFYLLYLYYSQKNNYSNYYYYFHFLQLFFLLLFLINYRYYQLLGLLYLVNYVLNYSYLLFLAFRDKIIYYFVLYYCYYYCFYLNAEFLLILLNNIFLIEQIQLPFFVFLRMFQNKNFYFFFFSRYHSLEKHNLMILLIDYQSSYFLQIWHHFLS